MAKWLPLLEKKLEEYSVDSNPAYRVYISAEPAGTRDSHIIPQGILEASIKITNEPPTGMFANLHKALDNFNQVKKKKLHEKNIVSLVQVKLLLETMFIPKPETRELYMVRLYV